MRIAIVGSNPSKFNTDPNIPFVGTRSHSRLVRWINYIASETELSSSNFFLLNISNRVSEKDVKYTNEEMKNIIYDLYDYDMVITLGNSTKKALIKGGVFQFNIPHPSFKNRKLNNPLVEKELLDELIRIILIHKQFINIDPDWSYYH